MRMTNPISVYSCNKKVIFFVEDILLYPSHLLLYFSSYYIFLWVCNCLIILCQFLLCDRKDDLLRTVFVQEQIPMCSFIYIYIYDFIHLFVSMLVVAAQAFLQLRRPGIALDCGAWASHCGGFSRWGTGFRARRLQYLRRVGSIVAAPRLQSSRSIVEVRRLSSAARGVFPVQGGWNLCLLHWPVDCLPLSYQGIPECFLETILGSLIDACEMHILLPLVYYSGK